MTKLVIVLHFHEKLKLADFQGSISSSEIFPISNTYFCCIWETTNVNAGSTILILIRANSKLRISHMIDKVFHHSQHIIMFRQLERYLRTSSQRRINRGWIVGSKIKLIRFDSQCFSVQRTERTTSSSSASHFTSINPCTFFRETTCLTSIHIFFDSCFFLIHANFVFVVVLLTVQSYH